MWLSWIIWKDNPDPLNTALALYLVFAIVGLVGAYIFGSVWDYKTYLEAIGRR